MQALRLALALIRVPRLFLSLVLFPLLLSMVLVHAQLIITGLYLKSSKRDAATIIDRLKKNEEDNLIRRLLYSDGAPRKTLKVCRWIYKIFPDKGRVEVPLTLDCLPDRLDIALHVEEPQT